MTKGFTTGSFSRARSGAARWRGATRSSALPRDAKHGITETRGTLRIRTLDLSDASAVPSVVAQAFEVADGLDVIVNNAGSGLLGAIEDAGDAEAERLLRVNVFGTFRVIRAALPLLRQQGHGHHQHYVHRGACADGGFGPYSASKSAVEGSSQSLAREVGPLGLKVTAIAPGAFRTDFLSARSIRKRAHRPRGLRSLRGKSMGRLAEMAGSQVGDPNAGAGDTGSGRCRNAAVTPAAGNGRAHPGARKACFVECGNQSVGEGDAWH